MKKYKKFLGHGILLAVIVATAMLSFASSSRATGLPGGDYLTGYGLSNNFGLISFNCSDAGTCGAQNYSVKVDALGNLTGYAWANPRDTVAGADNVGWIKFGGLSGFPTSDTSALGANAKLVVSGNSKTIKGWARFCGPAVTPTSCSGGTGANSGGWDGWISFDGTNRGVSISSIDNPTGSGIYPVSGKVWGANFVDSNGNGTSQSMNVSGTPSTIYYELMGPGWIDMSNVLYHGQPVVNQASFTLFGNGTPADTTLSLNVGDTLALSWTNQGLKPGNNCTASGNWSGTRSSNDGTFSEPLITYTAAGQYTYTLTCSTPTGVSPVPPQTITVSVQPPHLTTPHFELFGNGTQADDTITIAQGTNLVLAWNTEHMKTTRGGCTATSADDTRWAGSKSSADIPVGSPLYSQTFAMNTAGTFHYKLSCVPSSTYANGAFASLVLPTQTITVIVTGGTPLLNLRFNATSQGGNNNITAVTLPLNTPTVSLKWSTPTNTVLNNCVGTFGLSDWSGAQNAPSSSGAYTTPQSFNVTGSPAGAQTSYQLTCDDPSGNPVVSNLVYAVILAEDLHPALHLYGRYPTGAGSFVHANTQTPFFDSPILLPQSCSIGAGCQVDLNWDTTDINSLCFVASAPSGKWPAPATRMPNGTDTATINTSTTFTMSCATGMANPNQVVDSVYFKVGTIPVQPAPAGPKKPKFIEF